MADQAALPSIFLINNVVQSRSPGRGALKSAPRPDVNSSPLPDSAVWLEPALKLTAIPD